MVAETEAVVRLTRLKTDLTGDRAAMDARESEVAELVGRWDQAGSLGRPELVLIAVNLHGWYTALETALERVARLLDQTVPDGGSWHLDLLAQMQLEVPGVRPAIVPEGFTPELHELRKFRHFFRNAYALELDAALVRQRAADLLRVCGPQAVAMAALRAHIDATLSELLAAPTVG